MTAVVIAGWSPGEPNESEARSVIALRHQLRD
jgi:hypothetical protein